MDIAFIVVGALAVELLTLQFRLLHKLCSVEVKEKLGLPRIHHSYFGALFILASFTTLPEPHWLWIIGWSLVLSDIAHHYVVLPLLKLTKTDIAMKYSRASRAFFLRLSFIVTAALGVMIAFASMSNTLWGVVIALAMITVSERLHILLPRIGCPQTIAVHFDSRRTGYRSPVRRRRRR